MKKRLPHNSAFSRPAAALLCAALIGLAGCSSAKETLGLTTSAPDEFAVLKRAPLEMPPDYALRPPQPGAPRPQEAREMEASRNLLFSEESSGAGADSGTQALLAEAGATSATPAIRSVVDSETAKLEPKEKPVAKRILNIGRNDPPPASVVNAKAEAERLKKNQAAGKPVTEGETPAIEQ